MFQNGKKEALIAYLYLAFLFLAWTRYVAFIYPHIAAIDGLFAEITEETIRVRIFLAPLYFIHKTIQTLSFEHMGITNKLTQDVKNGLISSVIFLSIALLLTLLSSGKSISFDGVSAVPFWSAVSIAVITEEIVFRGYLLSVFGQYNRTFAVFISAILFVFIHYPGWWLLETHSTIGGWVQASGSIFFLGIILSVVFLRYKSLLACIMIHATNNLISSISG